MKKLLLASLLLGGCASPGIDRADQNEIIKEYYASVHSVKEVTLSSEVGTGIAGGATVGLIDNLDGNHQDMIAGSLAGALVGGLFTAIFEGSNTAYEYALSSPLDGDFAVVQKQKIDIQSQCVKVRVGHEVTLSAAANAHCAQL